MDNFVIRKNKIIRKNKRVFSQLSDVEEDNTDDHYKYIFDYDENSSFVSNTSKKLHYSWIQEDKLKKKKNKNKRRTKVVQAKKKRKLNQNRKIDQYFVPLNKSHPNNSNLSLPKKPLYTALDYENTNIPLTANNDNDILPSPLSDSDILSNINNCEYNNDLWCKQYEPKNVNDIIGNESAIDKLRIFLNDWKENTNILFESQKTPKNKNKRRKNNLLGYYSGQALSRQQYMNKMKNNKDSINRNRIIMKNRHTYPIHKAGILYGKSGSGKTMTINLLGLELGFDIICYSALEFNTKMCDIFDNDELSWNFNLQLKQRLIVIEDADIIISDKRKLRKIMNGIKNTKIPIILIINNYKWCDGLKQLKKQPFCQSIEFQRPTNEIAYQLFENVIKINDSDFIDNLVKEFDGDLRSCFSIIQFWCDTYDVSIDKYLANPTPIDPSVLSCILSMKNNKFIENNNNKLWRHKHDTIMDIFESNKKFFNYEINSCSTMHAGIDWFFNCSTLTPLFIHENYLLIQNRDKYNTNINDLDALSQAAALIADGELLNTIIQKTKNYKLMPIYSVVSCWEVSKIICQRFGGINFDKYKRIKFPQWFAQNKKQQKNCKDLNNSFFNCNKQFIIDKLHYLLDYGPYLLLILKERSRANLDIYQLLNGYGLMYSKKDKQKEKIDMENIQWFNKFNFKTSNVRCVR